MPLRPDALPRTLPASASEARVTPLPVMGPAEVLEDRVGEFDSHAPRLRGAGIQQTKFTKPIKNQSLRGTRCRSVALDEATPLKLCALRQSTRAVAQKHRSRCIGHLAPEEGRFIRSSFPYRNAETPQEALKRSSGGYAKWLERIGIQVALPNW